MSEFVVVVEVGIGVWIWNGYGVYRLSLVGAYIRTDFTAYFIEDRKRDFHRDS